MGTTFVIATDLVLPIYSVVSSPASTGNPTNRAFSFIFSSNMQSDKEVPDPQAPQETILVTGGSGLVGSHVIRELLQVGYKVRFTARPEGTAKRIWDAHAPDKARLSSITVPNMCIPGAHEEAVKRVDGVIHTASAFTFTPQDNVNDLLILAFQGTRVILQSIHEHNPGVSRVVLISSIAAMMDFSMGFQRDHL